MKAAVFKQAGVPLVIEEVVDPEPGPDDLIIKVKAWYLWHRSTLVSRYRFHCGVARPTAECCHGA